MHTLPALLVLALIASFIYSLVWGHSDAKRPGKAPWMVAMQAWPAGHVVWPVLRPDERDGTLARDGGRR